MRIISTISFSITAAFFLSLHFIPHEFLLIFCCAAALFSISGLLFKGYVRLRVIVIFLSLAFGFGWSFFFTEIFITPTKHMHEQTSTVTAVVVDFPVERDRGYHVDVKLRQMSAPSVNARIYFTRSSDISPGDVIKFAARFRTTFEHGDRDRFDFLTSRRVFLSGYVSGDIELINSDNNPLSLARVLSQHIADKTKEIFPCDISPFMQALLTGRRTELNRDIQTSSALSGSGIIHIVSISGMHVAFLMGFLSFLIKDRRLFALWGIPVLFLLMAMTGFAPGVTRAGIMQIFLICAPLFKRESDSITSLSSALLLLLIINPYAVASVGLQLSFAATLGIMLISPGINYKLIKPVRASKLYKNYFFKKISHYAISGFATSIGALAFTFPLTAIHFGTISIIAPITNLLTLWAVSIIFPIGLIINILAFIHTGLSAILAVPITFIARYIIFISRTMASIPYATVYTSNAPVMFWLLYVYIVFISMPLLKARLRQYFPPACTAIVLLCIIILITPLTTNESTTALTVLDVGQGQSISITSNGHTAIIDCGSNSGENAGSIVQEYLLNRGKTKIDFLIITHFHADHVNGVEFLLSRMSVSKLVIPDPDKSFLAEDIINLARRRGTDIIYVTETLRFSFGNIDFFVYPPLGEGCINERGLSILTVGDLTALITGDMNSSTERALLRFASIPELDALIVGHHGSRHSTSEELLYATSPTIAIIPVGRNSFGHPTYEVLSRLDAIGSVIYRTDHMGNITVRPR